MTESGEYLVIDASIVIAWLFEDESSDIANAVANRMQHAVAVVPVHFQFEVANVMLQSVRRGRISAEEVTEYWQILASLPIVVDQNPSWGSLQQTYDLATAHRLTVYDAAYLGLAARRSIELATLDGDLLKAADKLGIPVIST